MSISLAFPVELCGSEGISLPLLSGAWITGVGAPLWLFLLMAMVCVCVCFVGVGGLLSLSQNRGQKFSRVESEHLKTFRV